MHSPQINLVLINRRWHIISNVRLIFIFLYSFKYKNISHTVFYGAVIHHHSAPFSEMFSFLLKSFSVFALRLLKTASLSAKQIQKMKSDFIVHHQYNIHPWVLLFMKL